MKSNSFVKIALILAIGIGASKANAQNKLDTTNIQSILDEEANAWNKGDAETYSKHFAEEGTFTNVLGMFFIGHKLFLERHDQIFKGVFNKTTLEQKIVSCKFVRPDVAVVETITAISGLTKGPPAGTYMDSTGHFYTRLLQVFVKKGDDWSIVSYHNVDLKAGTPVPKF